MKLIILNDYDQVSEWAAKYIRNRIRKFNPGPHRFFTLGLPTGETMTESLCDGNVYLIRKPILIVCVLQEALRSDATRN